MRELSKKEQNLIAGGIVYSEVYSEFYSFVEEAANNDYNRLVNAGIQNQIFLNTNYYLHFSVLYVLGAALYGSYAVCETVLEGYQALASALFSPLAKK